MKPAKLFTHQQETVDFIKKKKRVFITSEPGTGKTRSCLETCSHHGTKVLVFCPKTIMDASWGNDIRTFYPHKSYGIFNRKLQSGNPHHIDALFRNHAIVIMNHDAVKFLIGELEKNPNLIKGFNRIVIDEFTAFKNKNSQRSKAMAKLVKHFDRRIMLSGTPTPNGILDIWHPAFLLDDGQRLGDNYYQFRYTVCQPVPKGKSLFMEWQPIPGASEGTAIRLRDVTIRHELQECIDMPERIYRHIQLDMPRNLRKHYEDMRKHALMLFEEGTVTAVNAGVLSNKLLQIAGGSIYNNDYGQYYLDDSKYDLIAELIKEREHSLVFYIWQHQCDRMSDIFDAEGIKYATINGKTNQQDRGRIVKDYQAGKYDTLLVQPAAAAHGLTLTKSTASIWCSGTFNLEHFIQANYRDYRIGQKKRTEVIMVSYKDTVEQKLYDRLREKRINQDTLLEILKS